MKIDGFDLEISDSKLNECLNQLDIESILYITEFLSATLWPTTFFASVIVICITAYRVMK